SAQPDGTTAARPAQRPGCQRFRVMDHRRRAARAKRVSRRDARGQSRERERRRATAGRLRPPSRRGTIRGILTAPLRYLDAQTLARRQPRALRARRVVEGALSGLHRAPHYGSSVEFAEHKEYSPGDEIRHIDWKAYGKFDRYYVKRFEQETELSAYLLLDSSGSMAYRGAGVSKLEYAAYLAAALTYLMIRQQDRVGLLAFGADDPRYVPPRAPANRLRDLLMSLEKVAAEGGRGTTLVAPALDRVGELARRRRSLVIVLSDLFDPSQEVVNLLRRLRVMRHDVAVLHV